MQNLVTWCDDKHLKLNIKEKAKKAGGGLQSHSVTTLNTEAAGLKKDDLTYFGGIKCHNSVVLSHWCGKICLISGVHLSLFLCIIVVLTVQEPQKNYRIKLISSLLLDKKNPLSRNIQV